MAIQYAIAHVKKQSNCQLGLGCNSISAFSLKISQPTFRNLNTVVSAATHEVKETLLKKSFSGFDPARRRLRFRKLII